MSHLSTAERWPSYTSEESNSGTKKPYTQIFPRQLFIIKWLFEAAWFEMLDVRAMEMVSQLECTRDGQRELETNKDCLAHISTIYHLCGIL